MTSNYVWTNASGQPSVCSPPWGDGIRNENLLEEWDDNNLINMDGCDENCKVEFNFIWDPDPITGVDKCVPEFFPPAISKHSINSESSIISFIFNDTMANFSFTESQVICEFSGSSFDYEISWVPTFISKEELIVRFLVTPQIVGGIDEALSITLKDVSAFKSKDGISISTPYEFKYTFDDLQVSEVMKMSGTVFSFAFIVTFLISILVNILTGSSMELMWSLANTLQIIFILGLLDLNYPANLRFAFSLMNYANFDNPLTPYLAEFMKKHLNIISASISSEFEF